MLSANLVGRLVLVSWLASWTWSWSRFLCSVVFVFGSPSHLGWHPSLHGGSCLGSRTGGVRGRIWGSHHRYGGS
jgi:hypothetical protein